MKIEDMYNVNVVDNNIIYSVDMLRLKTYITYAEFSNIEFMLKGAYKDAIDKFWMSDRVMCFKYNYTIEVGEGKSIYIAFHHNQEKIRFDKPMDKFNFTIEFNPNKLKNNSLLMYLLSVSGQWYIKSYDIAFDLKINILDLLTDMSGRQVEHVISHGYDNRTKYIGSGDGRIKVYNKKIESNLNILGDLTRIEMSRKMEDFEVRKIAYFKYDENFPIVYTNNYMFSFSDYKNKTMLAILYAVQNGFPLRDLSRDYRKKVKSMLEGSYRVKFNNKCVTQVIAQTIYYYFMKNDNVVWF